MTAPQQPPTVVDGIDIDAVHTAVAACPGVHQVGSPGLAGVTTYLPGRRIPGIRISPDSVDLEVVAAWGFPVPLVAGQIRAAVRGLVKARPVDITIADIDVPEQSSLHPEPPATALPAAVIVPPPAAMLEESEL